MELASWCVPIAVKLKSGGDEECMDLFYYLDFFDV